MPSLADGAPLVDGVAPPPRRGTEGAVARATGAAAKDTAAPLALLAAALPASELEHELRATCRILCALVHYYKRNRSRTPMQAAWRQRQPKTGSGMPSSKLEKLRRSVRGRLVESFSHDVIDSAIGDVCRIIEAHWNK